MKYRVLTWNPGRFQWRELPRIVAELNAGRVPASRGPNTGVNRWSCSNIRDFASGDRLPLLKQGDGVNGFVGVARCVSDGSYEDAHYADPSKSTMYIDLEWELLINPSELPPVTADDLRPDIAAQVNWTAQNSGQRFRTNGPNTRNEVGDYIYQSLQSLCGQVRLDHLSSEERDVIRGGSTRGSGTQEGDRRLVTHLRRERSGLRRQKLDDFLRNNGSLSCESCGLMNQAAGDYEESVFEVHHNAPLSLGPRETGLEDLSVLCANCHRLIHALMRDRGAAISISELRDLIA